MNGRRKLPTDRPSFVRKIMIDNTEVYVIVGFYGDGTPGEVFTRIAKNGSTMSGLMDALTTTLSVALQHGVPWAVLREKYHGHAFPPCDDKTPSLVHALADAVDHCLAAARVAITGGKP